MARKRKKKDDMGALLGAFSGLPAAKQAELEESFAMYLAASTGFLKGIRTEQAELSRAQQKLMASNLEVLKGQLEIREAVLRAQKEAYEMSAALEKSLERGHNELYKEVLAGRLKVLEGQLEIRKDAFNTERAIYARLDALENLVKSYGRPTPGYDGPKGPGYDSTAGAEKGREGAEEQPQKPSRKPRAPRKRKDEKEKGAEEPQGTIDDTVKGAAEEQGGDDAEAAEESDKSQAYRLYDAAKQARKDGEYKQALSLVRQASETGFDRPDLIACEMATNYLLLGDLNSAEKIFMQIMSFKGASEEAHIIAENNLGYICEQKGETEMAGQLAAVKEGDERFWFYNSDAA